jgi:hypothetical protein
MVLGAGASGRVGRRQADIIQWGYSSVGRAPALQAGGQRFESAYLHQDEPLAQLVEHLTFNQGVEGSSPSWLTKYAEVAQW